MTTIDRFSFFLRDGITFQRIDRFDLWTRFTIINRFNGIGSWNLEVPTKSKLGQLLTPTTGIIVQYDNETIFSGSAGSDYLEDSVTTRISGECDNALLRCPARPTPSLAAGPYPNEYYVITDVASTVLRDLMLRNIGGLAPPEWNIPQLTGLADPLLGGLVTARARFDPLILLMAELASSPIAGGLGFRILQDHTLSDLLLFDVYSPQDKTEDVVFSIGLRTAADYEWRNQQPRANYYIVAGGDNFGLYRTVVEGGDATSIAQIGRRIPEFVDRRGVTNTSELEQELAELLAGTITINTFTVQPADTKSLQYKRDWDLGDIVSIVVRDTTYTRLIREIEIDFDPNKGPIIKPMLSDPGGTNDDIMAQHVSSLASRISNIERNWNVPDNSLIPSMFHTSIRDMPGDIKLTARSAAQEGWLLCIGTSLLRSQYPALFSAIGTLFGQGSNPGVTFAIPDLRNRFPIGAGSAFGLGDTGGATSITVNLGSHSHGHAHAGGTLVYSHVHTERAHTHPGSHSHGIGSHSHNFAHGHSIDHNHALASTGGVNYTADVFGRDGAAATGTGHFHNYDLPAITFNSGNPFPDDITDGASGSSDSDSNVFSAQWTGALQGPTSTSWSGATTADSTLASLSQSGISVQNPYLGINFEIYAGVIP